MGQRRELTAVRKILVSIRSEVSGREDDSTEILTSLGGEPTILRAKYRDQFAQQDEVGRKERCRRDDGRRHPVSYNNQVSKIRSDKAGIERVFRTALCRACPKYRR